jgi:hypothetical protein
MLFKVALIAALIAVVLVSIAGIARAISEERPRRY